VSRALGAGGEEIASSVAEQLGFRYIDDEIVLHAAALAGVSPAEVARAEHSPPLVARVLESLASAPPVSEGGFVAVAPVRSLDYIHLIEHVVKKTAVGGKVVIVAHGASHALGGQPEVLRVFITASPDTRAARLAGESGLDARAALEAIEASDKERARYLDRFYGVKHELPVQYDLTLNTDVVEQETAASLIVAAAKA
jgi:cytidylate kinase